MAPKAKITPTHCPLCEFSAKRITSVDKHVRDCHGLEPKDAYDSAHGKKMCECGCGNETSFVNLKHGYSRLLKGHNANIYSLYSEEDARKISAKRIKKLKGQKNWAKGLTKETDERIKRRGEATATGRKKAFGEGRITIWSKGKTKHDDKRLMQQANNAKNDFESGKRQPWSKGLTEETDSRLAKRNKELRERYKKGELVPWHKGKTIVDDPRLNSRVVTKELAHARLTEDQLRERLQLNTQIKLERVDRYKNNRTPALWMRCNSCDWFEKTTFLFALGDRCPRCAPEGSRLQHEIADWIESNGVTIGRNVRGLIGRQELDIYVPVKNFAVEVNGLYWHNELAGKDHRYHQEKSDRCNRIGISLMHVFEDEWRDKRNIVKSMIRHRLGLSSRKLNARDCIVKSVGQKEKQAFFNAHHIDGDTPSTVAFGLELDGQLVACMSLRRAFHRKYKGSIEVARMCTSVDTVVRGGLSRLTKRVVLWAKENGYASVISYVDSRLGGGVAWTNAGFTTVSKTTSRFWWTDCENRFNRFKYRADRKRKMSEAQVADEAGVVKIWGCGNVLMTLTTT